MKKEILIASHSQFGYTAGYAQYCKYLKKDYDITYLCWDYNRKRMFEEGVKILYISRKGSLVTRNFRFITTLLLFLRKYKYHCIFICYFQGCAIIPLLYKRKQFIHLNIMTGNVSLSAIRRKICNLILRLESSCFNSISTISESLKKFLKINQQAHIFPLGADPIQALPNPRHKLSLLYVGVLSDRKIEDTIEGLAIFVRKHPEVDIHYTIVGDGWGNSKDLIQERIIKYHLGEKVSMEGYILQKNLKPYFEKNNIGVAYIPQTSYFNCQPSTKVYEYLMAGLPVIATGTYENKKIINKNNGIITDDTPKSFALGLHYMYRNIRDFNPGFIKESVSEYKWENIVGEMKNTIAQFEL